jgi:hypothetical protein
MQNFVLTLFLLNYSSIHVVVEAGMMVDFLFIRVCETSNSLCLKETSKKTIVASVEAVVDSMGLKVHSDNYKVIVEIQLR